MNCLAKNGKLQPYWVLTSDDKLLRELIHNSVESVKEKLGCLMLGEQVEVFVSETMRFDEIRNDDAMLWNLLVLGGYLKVLGSHFNGRFYTARVAIPNQEVLLTYQGIFSSWLVDTSETFTHQSHMLAGLVAGDLEKFKQETQYFLESAASVHDYATQPEAFYHGFTLALLASIMDRFHVFSNTESGHGRPDVILIPKDKNQQSALILEFKIAKPKEDAKKLASEALKQIKVGHYSAKIQQYDQIREILMVAVIFKGKTVYCQSDRVDLN
jgi:hypothetical protein